MTGGPRVVRWRAAWVVPIAAAPLPSGWVDVADGRILRLGRPGNEPSGAAVDDERDLGDAVLLPGLVNAHTHLELSALRGRVPPAPSLPAWVRCLLEARAAAGNDGGAAVRAAVREIEAAGTAAVGDIGNTTAALAPLVESRLHAVSFRELLGFRTSDAEARAAVAASGLDAGDRHGRVRSALAAHAPYSTSADLFRAVLRASRDIGGAPMSVHLAESTEEVDFLLTGGGPWRDLLDELGAWQDGWPAPGCGPVALLERLEWLSSATLVVHGVALEDGELRRLAAARATLVTCPRSNQWVGAGPPPIERFRASGVRIAVGTDSLASAPDLNLFAELAELRRLAPAVPASELLCWATLNGARALGFDHLGAIVPGHAARLVAVDLPAGVEDVEEHLVQGVAAERITAVGEWQCRT